MAPIRGGPPFIAISFSSGKSFKFSMYVIENVSAAVSCLQSRMALPTTGERTESGA